MQSAQHIPASIPSPSQWGIHATVAGRPIIWGILNIHTNTGNRVSGTVNFRGNPIPINGHWDEDTKQIRFDSPYATFSGHLTIFDDASIRIRHLIFEGQLIMNPPSAQAGQHGTWVATTDTKLTGPPIKNHSLPPVGVFLTSNFLHGKRY